MSHNTAFVFIPGAFHTSAHFQLIIKALESKGFASYAVDLPSVGHAAPSHGLDHEINAIREAILEFSDKGKDIVLVAHSYGGFPGSRAIAGLDQDTRSKEGKRGVKRVYFISAFLLPEDVSMHDIFRDAIPPWIDDGVSILLLTDLYA